MHFTEALNNLEKSNIFSKWKQKNKNAYLVNGLLTKGFGKNNWQLSFYCPKRKKVDLFKIDTEGSISINSSSPTKEKEMKKISPKKVIINDVTAIKIAEKIKQQDFPQEISNKSIALLQNFGDRVVWSITLITNSFNLINIKIDSTSGKIVDKKLTPVFTFEAG